MWPLLALVVVLGAGAAAYFLFFQEDDCVSKYSGNPLPCDAGVAILEEEYEAREEADPGSNSDSGESLRDQRVKRARRVLERNITRDAQEDAADGLIEGPIQETSCELVGRGGDVQRFNCIAANEVTGSRLEGFEYNGTANLKSGEVTWELGD